MPEGTPVTDNATLSGANASSAGGTATYSVYSLSYSHFPISRFGLSSWWGWWRQPVAQGEPVQVTDGVVPPSSPLTLDTPGVYLWVVTYSGDSANRPSHSMLGSETEIVTSPPRCPTQMGWVSVWCFANSNPGGGSGFGFGQGGGSGYGRGGGSSDGQGGGSGYGRNWFGDSGHRGR